MTDDHSDPLIAVSYGKMFEGSHPLLTRLYTPKIQSRWNIKSMPKNCPPRKSYENWFINY